MGAGAFPKGLCFQYWKPVLWKSRAGFLTSLVYACTGEKRAFVPDDEQPSIGKLRDEVGIEFVGRCRQSE